MLDGANPRTHALFEFNCLVLYPPMPNHSVSHIKQQGTRTSVFIRGADAKAIPHISSHRIASHRIGKYLPWPGENSGVFSQLPNIAPLQDFSSVRKRWRIAIFRIWVCLCFVSKIMFLSWWGKSTLSVVYKVNVFTSDYTTRNACNALCKHACMHGCIITCMFM